MSWARSVCQSTRLSVSLSVCLPVFLSVHQEISLYREEGAQTREQHLLSGADDATAQQMTRAHWFRLYVHHPGREENRSKCFLYSLGIVRAQSRHPTSTSLNMWRSYEQTCVRRLTRSSSSSYSSLQLFRHLSLSLWWPDEVFIAKSRQAESQASSLVFHSLGTGKAS